MASRPTRMSIRVDRLARKCETSLKIGYADKGLALDAAEAAMEAGRVSPGCHITPYECQDCGEWHLANRRIVPVAPEDASRRDWTKGRAE